MSLADLVSPMPGSPSRKRTHSNAAQGPGVPVPTLSSLATQFSERDSLYAHLDTLPKPILISILLAQAKDALPAPEAQSYGPSNNLAHCVYCHQVFDKTATEGGCQVEHLGELDITDDDDVREYTCCGALVDGYSEYYDDAPSPSEFASPYCYEGKHSDKLFQDGDADAPKGRWWKDWEECGSSCSHLHCDNKPNGGHLVKKAKHQ